MVTTKEEPLATTEQFDGVTIVKSDEYGRYADLLATVLEKDKLYTHDEVQAIIKNELARPVVKNINA